VKRITQFLRYIFRKKSAKMRQFHFCFFAVFSDRQLRRVNYASLRSAASFDCFA
jgi:hypothetical protein